MFTIIEKNLVQVNLLEKLFITNDQVVPVAAGKLKEFKQEDIAAFCHIHALYQLPTIELIQWLRLELQDFLYPAVWGHKVIEVGSGNGCIARNIPVVGTDNYLQTQTVMRLFYEATGQPIIKYGDDVLRMDAGTAVDTFKPEVVIGCWVTQYGENETIIDSNPYGIKELQFLGKINRYIMIGNERVHSRKLVLKQFPYRAHKFNWLYSRSMEPEKNIIYDIDFTKK